MVTDGVKEITVKNADGDANTTAKILIQNKIDYTPKVSVIIPVYNVEQYLRECLDSVINQTLKEIEIICVDDGSTDSSLEILTEYANRDNRITVIAQQNLHAGVARNAGLAVARGEYLSFLDSDDFFELNMLEETYNKAKINESDIVICKCRYIDSDTGKIDDLKLDYSLRLDLLPAKETFSAKEISNKAFQFCQGFPWDKLFRTDFIKQNQLKFQNLLNTNDAQFAFTAICLAERITVTDKRLITKRHQHKTSLSATRKKGPDCFIYAIEKIKSNLESKNIFKLFERSFWDWAISLCLIQLKTLDFTSKTYLYQILHKKFNEWNLIDNSAENSNRFRAIHYIKNQPEFPTITVAYSTNKKFLDLCSTSILSILKNKTFENINVIILTSELTKDDIILFEKLKNNYSNFEYNISYVSDKLFKDFPLVWTTQETWYRCVLADKFPEYNKILYLDCDTIVRKSLLALWEIDLSDKYVAVVENVTESKNKAELCNLRDGLYFNAGVILMNTTEWRKNNLFFKIQNYVKTEKVFEADQGTLNVVTDTKKASLPPSYNFMDVWWRDNNCQYDAENLKIYNEKDPTIVHFVGTKPTKVNCKNYFKNEFSRYYDEIIKLQNKNIIISLTSYPARIGTVNQTIESLLNQTTKADKVILWLAPEQFPNKEADLPQQLLDLRSHGLTIDWYHDIRSYKKLIPTLRLYPNAIIVTADDDNIYQSTWLEKLYISYKKYPNNIHAHRVTKFYHDKYGWHTIAGGKEYYKGANYLNKLVGLGGVLYPPHCFYKDILNEDLIKQLAPTNDDQWFWIMGALNGFPVRVVENPEISAHYVPGTQETGLTKVNDHGQKLFWKDFNRLMEYYPVAKEILINESKKHKINQPFVVPYKKELEQWYIRKCGYLNLDKPKTFNEKIQWLKLYDSTPIKTRLADKYLVRDWVAEKIGGQYLIPLLGVYDSFDEIDFDKLPDQFVIKCNHSSGWNAIVTDKSQINIHDLKEKFDKWLATNFAYCIGLELHYRDIPPKIIIEQFVSNDGKALYDYKFWCFNGKVKYMQFRDDYSSDLKMVFYDLDWHKQPFYYDHPLYNKKLEKPDNFDEMVKIAEKLCQGFAFVCVDLYRLNDGTIKFGEMTFTRSSGTGRWNDEKYNKILGKLIKLPKLAYNIDTGEYYKLPRHFHIGLMDYLLFPWYLYRTFKLRKKYEKLLFDKIINDIRRYRIDVRYNNISGNIDVNGGVSVDRPAWMNGQGCVISCEKRVQHLDIKSYCNGKMRLFFRGRDYRENGKIFPVYITYKSIKIDGMEILGRSVNTWHDEPYRYELDVKNGQNISIDVETTDYNYSESELYDVVCKTHPSVVIDQQKFVKYLKK